MGIKRHKPEEIITKLQQVEVLCGSPQQTGCARHHRTHYIVQCLGRVCVFAQGRPNWKCVSGAALAKCERSGTQAVPIMSSQAWTRQSPLFRGQPGRRRLYVSLVRPSDP